MQKLVFTIALIFSLNVAASAATNFSLFFNDTRGIEQTRKMAAALQLNEMTFIQVKQLNDAKFKALDQAAVLFANDAAKKDAQIKEIEASFTAQINALLNPVQQASYQAFLNAAGNTNLAVSK